MTLSRDKIANKLDDYKNKNKLFKCKECDRLCRRYQVDLVLAATGSRKCPHCGKDTDAGYLRYHFRFIDKPDRWMDTHSDCPKINLLGYRKIRKAMKSAKRLLEENEAINRFEEYNKLEVGVDWIMKLQKELMK